MIIMNDTIQERFNVKESDKKALDELMASFGMTSNEYFRICTKQALKYHGVPFKLRNQPDPNDPRTWNSKMVKNGINYIVEHSQPLTKQEFEKKIGL